MNMISIPLPYYILCLLSAISRLFIKKNWKTKGQEKKRTVESLIPEEWLLPLSITSKISENSISNVMDIPKSCGILTQVELKITEDYTATQLISKIRDGTYSATDITTAFCKRAAIAHQLVNCCTEFMFDMAMERAKELDEYYKVNGKVSGPLHGLPISLKDTFNVPGFDSTIGFVSFIDNKSNINEYSDIVKMLLDLGAVIYVKTNVPQTLMAPDTDNHVMGRCLNPLNTSLTAGGSSGGEAALIKLRGSILGVGTDVGGSLRIPLACCGTYSFKPTANRLPYANQTTPGEKDKKGFGIAPVLGPISNSFEDLQLFIKNILLQKPWMYDNEVLPIPFNNNTIKEKTKLRIGVIVEDKNFPVHPPIKRVIHEISEKLGKHHEIVLLDNFPSYLEMWTCCVHFFLLDSNFDTAKDLYSSGEPPIKALATNKAEELGLPPITMNGISKLIDEKKEFTSKWNQIFIDNNLDVIISPASASTAPPHDTFGATPYTAAWNLTNFPCTMIPYGKMEEADKTGLFQTLKGDCSHMCAQYDQFKYIGGECHVQLMCRNYEEEKLLSIGKIIDDILHNE